MASFEIKSAREARENVDLRQILTEIVNNLTIKDEKIKSLENKVADLEARVDECEIYSSKDCIIMENLLIKNCNNGNVPPLSHQVCDFLKSYINYETHPSSFEACHPLGSWKNGTFAPAVIVKFVYFGEKMSFMAVNLGYQGHQTLLMVKLCTSKRGSHPNSVKSKTNPKRQG